MLAFLAPLLSFLGGPVVTGLVNAYKAKLQATNTTDEHAVDLAKADLLAQIEARKQATALAGTPVIRVAQAAALWVVVIYIAKAIIWDKVVASFVGCAGHTVPGTCVSFTTDPIGGTVAVWVGLIISWAFGAQITSNVVSAIARRFKG